MKACTMQGHVLREGFKSGKLKSEFYDDFLEELPKWRQQGLKVYIYSSGSREAQRNLFACSATGDLREHICGFFDTTIGAKVGSPQLGNVPQGGKVYLFIGQS